jgi:Ala-tRNA(Pro) deacylase
MKVQEYLREKHVPFAVLTHPATYDSQHLAHELHVSGHEVAKTVLLRLDGRSKYAVAVLPASKRIDLKQAGQALGASAAELATEVEMHDHCPECEVGALPPFGSCYGMMTVVDESLGAHDQIVFEGDTHQEALRMDYADFRRLEQPLVAPIASEE